MFADATTNRQKQASCIYEGEIAHRRKRPKIHNFSYRIFLMYLDLAELPTLFEGSHLWQVGGRGIATFRRSDYYGDPAHTIENEIRDLVERETGERPDGPVRMLTNLRYLGHCFNPISIYYCFAADGETLAAAVAEVTNIPWGERHAYVLKADADGRIDREVDKELHVSPFMPMNQVYRCRVMVPADSLSVSFASTQDGEPVFGAALTMQRSEITPRSLRRVLVRHPAMTLSVVRRIYSQALRLRSKGLHVYRHATVPPREPQHKGTAA